MALLDEVLNRVKKLDAKEFQKAFETARKLKPELAIWTPNEGPQAQAFYSEADELFYGGQAGGGKSDLAVGLSLTSHRSSLILRAYGRDARTLASRAQQMAKTTKGFNGQLMEFKFNDKVVEFAGCRNDEEAERFKGRPHDLKAFDEISDFSEKTFRFICAWNRSAVPGQRSRILATGNPPTSPEGLWVVKYWGAWLDPTHPNPAKEGELRWYTNDGKNDIEVDGYGPHEINGEILYARSRTFIRARLSDNPFYAETNYGATLSALPAALRAAYRDGRFDISLKDEEGQLIPTAWIIAAQHRWKLNGDLPPAGVPMCSLAVDPAGNGIDKIEMVTRHDHWFSEIITIPKQDNEAQDDNIVRDVVKYRKDDCETIIDMGGGYGGSVWRCLERNLNPRKLVAYKGGSASLKRSKEGMLNFANKRTEDHWRLMEALDPSQDGGAKIMLPDNRELLSDLAAPHFIVKSGVIHVESKIEIKKRIGRSPGKGDVIIMANSAGKKGLLPSTKTDNFNFNYGFNSTPMKTVDKYALMRRKQ